VTSQCPCQGEAVQPARATRSQRAPSDIATGEALLATRHESDIHDGTPTGSPFTSARAVLREALPLSLPLSHDVQNRLQWLRFFLPDPGVRECKREDAYAIPPDARARTGLPLMLSAPHAAVQSSGLLKGGAECVGGRVWVEPRDGSLPTPRMPRQHISVVVCHSKTAQKD